MVASLDEIAPDDESLAATIARRDESDRATLGARAAFDVLYGRHARPLLAFLAARVAREHLDDLHQDVWMRVRRHLPGGFRGGQFRAWLYRIARNALIDHGRRKKGESLAEEVAVTDPRDHRPEGRMMEQERMEIMRRCLEHLDVTSTALVRARLGGEDYAAISGRLGLKPERAHKVFHEAKVRLKTCVERALA